jgi:hypothetical protein
MSYPRLHYLHIQDVRKIWSQWEFYLLFTLYAVYFHPDTLRIFSAILPCFFLIILESIVAKQYVIICLRRRRVRILTAYTCAFRNPQNEISAPFRSMSMPFLAF